MKLQHIQIQTNDIPKTIAFYTQTLGFQILKNDSTTVSFQIGISVLEFIEDKNFNSIYHLAFNIPNNKLDEAIKWCRNKVDLICIEDENVITRFETWNANAVYFYDNSGNLLEFIARHDLINSETKSFDTKSILSISEIGIVHESPLVLGQDLINKYQLNFFSKNANSEAFTAIGDDEGLLIIVKPNRNWYPTQTPSESNKTAIRLENNDRIAQLEF
ncbi:VOC family protein [Flavobacterium branchiarum]|uniref:VOC family protein n=1 Tax=Flavobacterium branchiarum TaxID=1114870 RepID=A0ABV5FRJ9_9FLAO|nr:VOC family protein [Flavobacterium branchiarum]MDN3673286.1 VOC family protein [Flavobacterium branchiarum]